MLISKPAPMNNKLVMTPLCLLLPNLKHQVTETLRPPYAAPTLCAGSWVSLPHEELGFMRR